MTTGVGRGAGPVVARTPCPAARLPPPFTVFRGRVVSSAAATGHSPRPPHHCHDYRTRSSGFAGRPRPGFDHSAIHRRRSRPSRAWDPGPLAPGVAPGSARPLGRPGFGQGPCRPMMGVIRQRVEARWRPHPRPRPEPATRARALVPPILPNMRPETGTRPGRAAGGGRGSGHHPTTVHLSVERAGSTAHRTMPRAPAAARPAREARSSPTAHEPEDRHGGGRRAGAAAGAGGAGDAGGSGGARSRAREGSGRARGLWRAWPVG